MFAYKLICNISVVKVDTIMREIKKKSFICYGMVKIHIHLLCKTTTANRSGS